MKAQTRIGNQNNTGKLVKVPLPVNPETIAENGQTGQIRSVRICSRFYPCIFAEVPEQDAHDYMQLLWKDAKKEERRERCLIPDGHGGYIMCPESNKCSQCQKAGSFDFDGNHPASLDAMFEDSGFDLVSPNADVFDETSEILQALVGQLSEIKPKYGQIFLELYKGNERPLHIAKALGIGKSQIYDDVKSVRELAAKMYWKMIE